MTGIKARPTLYKGIQMRSRLEADFAALLDARDHPWAYEPTCFAAEDTQWLPDFGITHHGTHTYIELKPAYLFQPQDGEAALDAVSRIDGLLRRMIITWQSEPAAVLELTFWTYGHREQEISLIGYQGRPWVIFTAGSSSLPLLWPGMGQLGSLDQQAGTKVSP